MRSYSQLSEFDILHDLDLDLANNRSWPVHNIQVYFGKLFLIDVSKNLTFGNLLKVKVKSQGQKSRSRSYLVQLFIN